MTKFKPAIVKTMSGETPVPGQSWQLIALIQRLQTPLLDLRGKVYVRMCKTGLQQITLEEEERIEDEKKGIDIHTIQVPCNFPALVAPMFLVFTGN